MPVAPASRVRALSGEGAFEVLAAARQLEGAGRHVVHLEIGEPDGATPPHVVEAGAPAPPRARTPPLDLPRPTHPPRAPPAGLPLRRGVPVVSDEVYGPIRSDGPADSIAALPGMLERTVIVDSFSKSYSMTGWRLGFGVLPAALLERVTMLVVNGTSCTPPFVQLAGLAALTGSQECVAAALARLERRRDWLGEGLNGLARARR